ncbi:hypothetical protein Tco_0840808 [Tanacetum coccineum]|uniref:Uncharacterized protein n=1 Tax=Tanacetum coccineum TaxID=301880 RepID=A0ABQ5AYY4_9ASTR
MIRRKKSYTFLRGLLEEHGEYLGPYDIAFVRFKLSSQENVHGYPSLIKRVFSPISYPREDSDPIQEESDIFLVPGDLIPLGVENDDSEDEDNSTFLPEHESPNLDHQDNPSAPRPPPEPPDVKIRLEPDTAVINNFDVLNKEACFNLEEGVQIFLPFFTYPEDSPFILSFGVRIPVYLTPDISSFFIFLSRAVGVLMGSFYSTYCILPKDTMNSGIESSMCLGDKKQSAMREAPHAYSHFYFSF